MSSSGSALPFTSELNDLLEHSETNTPFQRSEWMDSWWATLSEAHHAQALNIEHRDPDGRLLGIAPLMAVRRKYRKPIIRFIADTNSDYLDLIASSPEKLSLIRDTFSQLHSQLPYWNTMHLRNIPENSSTVTLLPSVARDLGFYVDTFIAAECPTLIISDREQEVDKLLRKYSNRRPGNRLIRKGSLRFRQLTDEGERSSLLELFFQQHRNRWNSKSGLSLFNDPVVCDFYRHFLKSTQDQEWVKFSALELDEKPIAFHIGFDYQGTFIWYKPSFDINLHRYSPGKALLWHLIDDARNRNLDEFDFALGNEDFKSHYSNNMRKVVSISVFRSRSAYLAHRSIRSLRTKIKNIASPSPNSSRVPKRTQPE